MNRVGHLARPDICRAAQSQYAVDVRRDVARVVLTRAEETAAHLWGYRLGISWFTAV